LQLCQACSTCTLSCGIEVLFHRTAEENIQGIYELGLLVSDGVNVPRAHGAELGAAVYLTPDFEHGTQYGNTSVICLALPGRLLPNNTTKWPSYERTPCFSRRWQNLVVACEQAAQVLPLAVVDDENVKTTCSKAQALVSCLENHFPGLKVAASTGSSSLVGGWQRLESRSRPGNFYYFNPDTGRCCVDDPHCVGQAVEVGSSSASRA